MNTPNRKVVLDWIRKLAAAKETTTLVLRRGERWGWIGFRNGDVVSVRTMTAQGMEAMHALVLWWDAKLYGDETADAGDEQPQHLPVSTEQLCAELELYLEEITSLSTDVELMKRHEQRVGVTEDVRSELDVEVAAVLDLFDGKRALVEVLQDSPYNILWTLRAASTLIEADVVKPVD